MTARLDEYSEILKSMTLRARSSPSPQRGPPAEPLFGGLGVKPATKS